MKSLKDGGQLFGVLHAFMSWAWRCSLFALTYHCSLLHSCYHKKSIIMHKKEDKERQNWYWKKKKKKKEEIASCWWLCQTSSLMSHSLSWIWFVWDMSVNLNLTVHCPLYSMVYMAPTQTVSTENPSSIIESCQLPLFPSLN